MWKYVFWWLGPGSDQYPCHLLCWINLIYHLNDLPAQFGRVTGNANNFSFHNIHMIGMPFQTWLLDLKFENDRVTCFGNRTVMNCFSFEPGSGQYMPNTSKHPNHLSSQISTGMNASGNQGCIALPFVISRMSLSYARASLPLPSCPHPHQTPSLRPFRADVANYQTQLGQSGVLFQGLGQRLAGDTWLEKHDEAHSTNTIKLQNVFSPASVFQIGQHHHLLARKRSVFGLLVFEFKKIWISPKNMSKLYSIVCSKLYRLEAFLYLDKASPRLFYRLI